MYVSNYIIKVKSAGRKVTVLLNNLDKVNSLTQFEALKIHNLNSVILAFRVTRAGVRNRNIPIDTTEEMICNEFNSSFKIVSVAISRLSTGFLVNPAVRRNCVQAFRTS